MKAEDYNTFDGACFTKVNNEINDTMILINIFQILILFSLKISGQEE